MKILFVITGIGLGHTIREEALINEILKNKPKTKIEISGFKNSYRYFKDKFKTSKIIGHKFPETSFHVSLLKTAVANIPYPLYFLHDCIKLYFQVKRFKPDLMIVDMQPVGVFIGKLLGIKTVSIYNLNLEKWDDFMEKEEVTFGNKIHAKVFFRQISNTYKNSDIVVIPTVEKQKKRGKENYVNPMIRVSPEKLPDVGVLMKKLELDKKPILVMLGGSEFGFSVTEHIINISKKSREQFVLFGYKDFEEDNVKSFKFKENFLEYLKVCKGVIVIAGHNTLSEVIVYKKPALIFPFKNYLEHYVNVYGLDDIATIRYLDNISFEIINESVKEFLRNIPVLQGRINEMNVKGNGASQAYKIIFDKK
ncbi:hypothetical protein CL617_02135 [archaeon]|nr:hypothetical protein [archaeon]|tara:strand:+ start:2647 stop:3741 length:1095 start_codon:yes stop_codon:yes gene_type:complete